MFDYAPGNEPTPGAITLNMPTIDPITALKIYADPHNWDHGATYIGPGDDGPFIAQAALRKNL